MGIINIKSANHRLHHTDMDLGDNLVIKAVKKRERRAPIKLSSFEEDDTMDMPYFLGSVVIEVVVITCR